MTEDKCYKWQTPWEWLEQKADEWNHTQLLAEFKSLAMKLTSDDIQDEYESEMEKDGYFEPIKAKGEKE